MSEAPPHILDLSPETAALAERLAAASVGEVVEFSEMSAAIGRDIKGRQHILRSALRVVLRDHGALFANVRSVGYQRLPAEEAHKVGARARERIRRGAHRGSLQITQAIRRANDLPPEAMRKAYSEQATLGLIEHLSRDVIQPKQEDGPEKPEPVGVTARRMLEALSK